VGSNASALSGAHTCSVTRPQTEARNVTRRTWKAMPQRVTGTTETLARLLPRSPSRPPLKPFSSPQIFVPVRRNFVNYRCYPILAGSNLKDLIAAGLKSPIRIFSCSVFSRPHHASAVVCSSFPAEIAPIRPPHLLNQSVASRILFLACPLFEVSAVLMLL
jgi:hypothetical protein